MFASARRSIAQILDSAYRGFKALEGILEAALVLNRTLDSAFKEHQPFRALAETVDRLVLTLEATEKLQREHGPAMDRVDALELSRVRFEAECEGILLKADGKLKAASASEARERQLKRSYEKRDPFENGDDERGPATEEERPLLRDAATGEPVVQPYADMSPKAVALRAKWGM